MAKVKYRYNPETLSYDVVNVTVKEKLTKWGIMVAASIVTSIIYFAVYSHFYDTPMERTLTNKLSDVRFNYQMLMQDLSHIDYLLSDIQKRDDNIYRTILESDPIPASIRQAGFGGANRYQHLEGYNNSNIMIAASRHTDRILKQLYVQSISYDELITKVLNKEQMNLARPAIMPVPLNLTRISSLYGGRRDPITREPANHTGIDFTAPTGTPIYVTGDGTVIRTYWSNQGYGNTIIVDHGFGIHTLYAHLHRIGVEVGDEVKRGDIIGTVGNTGRSIGPHLHYEVHINGRHTNPIFYFNQDLSPDEYVRMFEEAQRDDEYSYEWDNSLMVID